MGLEDLIAARQRAASSTSLEGPSAAPGGAAPSSPVEPVPSEGPSSEDRTEDFAPSVAGGGEGESVVGADPSPAAPSVTPYGVKEVTTPSGLGIYYQAGPKRLYRLRHATPKGKVTEVEVPSMSEVLGILEKGGLPWWGMKMGVQGLLELIEQDLVPSFEIMSVEGIVDLLKKHKLTVNDQRDKAGDRGTAVHDAFEAWAQKGIMPVPEVYAPEEQGYVEGLKQFLIDSGVEALDSETMVGSWKHKFAGRYDLRGLIPHGAEVFVHRTEKGRGDKLAKIEGGEWLLDLKTSKDVYVTHFLQLEGYEGASQECGYAPTDHRGVINVMADGRYKLVESTKTFADFLAVRKAYDAVQK